MKTKTEIERKFLVKQIPDLSGIRPVKYGRYIIFSEDGIEVRVQRKDNGFFLERKIRVSEYSRDTNKWEITKNEFGLFKKLSIGEIIRESYTISEEPNISIKVYHEKYEGLVRVEVEFSSEEEAINFVQLNWFGVEITGSNLASDSKSVCLSRKQMLSLIH